MLLRHSHVTLVQNKNTPPVRLSDQHDWSTVTNGQNRTEQRNALDQTHTENAT